MLSSSILGSEGHTKGFAPAEVYSFSQKTVSPAAGIAVYKTGWWFLPHSAGWSSKMDERHHSVMLTEIVRKISSFFLLRRNHSWIEETKYACTNLSLRKAEAELLTPSTVNLGSRQWSLPWDWHPLLVGNSCVMPSQRQWRTDILSLSVHYMTVLLKFRGCGQCRHLIFMLCMWNFTFLSNTVGQSLPCQSHRQTFIVLYF